MEKLATQWPVRLLACAAAVVSVAAWGQSTSKDSDDIFRAGPIIVPAGTPLDIQLTKGVNTKKVAVGDPVYARLHSPVVIGGWRAVDAGAAVQGSVIEVNSGSKEIGGAPRLVLTFRSITAHDGSSVPIDARYEQAGNSDTAKDAAKIAGGAAAGAVVGHQVDDDKGAVVGGVLGAAAGVAAAKNTGSDLRLESGTVLRVTTQSETRVAR